MRVISLRYFLSKSSKLTLIFFNGLVELLNVQGNPEWKWNARRRYGCLDEWHGLLWRPPTLRGASHVAQNLDLGLSLVKRSCVGAYRWPGDLVVTYIPVFYPSPSSQNSFLFFFTNLRTSAPRGRIHSISPMQISATRQNFMMSF